MQVYIISLDFQVQETELCAGLLALHPESSCNHVAVLMCETQRCLLVALLGPLTKTDCLILKALAFR